jgi:glycosyltransferase involved in cell wall biosynthesis
MTIVHEKKAIELTILMPCLNEAETLEVCIKKAQRFLNDNNINGEVLIADNGSTDGSQDIASANGARVVHIPEKGYGSALIGGCNASYGKYVIMGDADDSYNFLNLMPFLEKLREGYDLVMGNRFKGGIEKDAMPPLHKYLGNPVLSGIGRLIYHSNIGDFHCGLRGYNVKSIRALNLKSQGMEYASEMVVQATLHKLKVTEVPTTLSKDGRTRPPHLRSWSDGWRHLKYLLTHSPSFLFLYPGMLFILLGVICFITAEFVANSVSIYLLIISSILFICGFSLLLYSRLAKLHAINTNYIPTEDKRKKSKINDDKYIFQGLEIFLVGIVVLALSIGKINFFIAGVTLMVIGIELIFSGFLITILNIK